jgi:hypothetical protein
VPFFLLFALVHFRNPFHLRNEGFDDLIDHCGWTRFRSSVAQAAGLRVYPAATCRQVWPGLANQCTERQLVSQNLVRRGDENETEAQTPVDRQCGDRGAGALTTEMRSKNPKRAILPVTRGQRKGPMSDARWGKGLRRTNGATQWKLSHRPLHEGESGDAPVSPQIAPRSEVSPGRFGVSDSPEVRFNFAEEMCDLRPVIHRPVDCGAIYPRARRRKEIRPGAPPPDNPDNPALSALRR